MEEGIRFGAEIKPAEKIIEPQPREAKLRPLAKALGPSSKGNLSAEWKEKNNWVLKSWQLDSVQAAETSHFDGFNWFGDFGSVRGGKGMDDYISKGKTS